MITGIQEFDGNVYKEHVEILRELLAKAYPEHPQHQERELRRMAEDFAVRLKAKEVRFPGATFELDIRAQGKICQKCQRYIFNLFISDAGERWCSRCVMAMEDEVTYCRANIPPERPDWLDQHPADAIPATGKPREQGQGL